MSWRIRSYTHDRYKDFVLYKGLGLVNVEDFNRARDTIEADYGMEEGAVRTYIDLPRPDWGWLYDECEQFIRKANTSTWGFKLTGWNQELRFNVYQPGDKFVPHSDYFSKDRSKVAFVLPVMDAKSGGRSFLLDVDVPKLSVGDMLIFPAYHPHGVTEVLSGTRVCLVGWATGPRFH